MKRLIAILTAALTLSLTACGNSGGNSSMAGNSNPQSSIYSENSSEQHSEQGSQNAPSAAPDNNESKILIAYFTAAENSGVDAIASASYSMVNGEPVGRLRAIANMIQSETGGELFSIRTSVVYPADGGSL